MNTHINPSDSRGSNTRLNVEAILASALLASFVLAVVSTGQLLVAARVLALVGVWFVAVALLVGLAFGVVRVVGSLDA